MSVDEALTQAGLHGVAAPSSKSSSKRAVVVPDSSSEDDVPLAKRKQKK